MEDEEIIISQPNDDIEDKSTLEDVTNPEVITDPPKAEEVKPDPPKRGPGRPRKIEKMADFAKFSEEAFLDNAEDLTHNLYNALGQILVQMPTMENPNPKFMDLAAQLLGLVKNPSGISITNNTITNSGNTTLLHATGASFEQIARRYHQREQLGLNDEFKQKFIDPPSNIIDAEVVEVVPVEKDKPE
jgi:hypothetical protein